MDKVDAVVIGAGVVGLACARKLALSGLSTIILETESRLGQGASSRNSEVIHSGLYYQPGSLKAKLCREGREMLYEYCLTRNIGHSPIGKWIVANSEEQILKLENIAKTANQNGCNEVYWLSLKEAKKIEPELRAKKILVSPRTGIIDSHEYMLSLLGEIEANGGILVPNSKVVACSSSSNKLTLKVQSDIPCELNAKFVINSSGIMAPTLAKEFGCKNIPELSKKGFCKGNYFSFSGKSPFKRLIYPVPNQGGLGIHLTLDLNGRAKFGPDVEWVDEVSYIVDNGRKKNFIKEIKHYWPNIDAEKLSPDYAGFRAKLDTNDNFSDFVISSEDQNGIKGLVNLFGIESPGLTSSLAIAEEVVKKLI